MSKELDLKYLIDYVEEKIDPYELTSIGKNNFSILIKDFSKDELIDAVDISYKNYIELDKDGIIKKESVENFLNKIGGVAHNNKLPPINKKINHIKNYARNKFRYWNEGTANSIINNYIKALKNNNWSEEQIIEDLSKEVMDITTNSENWSQWRNIIENWTEDILNWKNDEKIIEMQTILPGKLYNNTRNYIVQLSKQINSSYENNLFDCTAVMMRRLMEVLIILMFQNEHIESKILEKQGNNYVSLEKMIKIANSESLFKLSNSTQQDMNVFRELGNLSAHKIWYNSTKKDIETLILRYRSMIEELLYKAKIIV